MPLPITRRKFLGGLAAATLAGAGGVGYAHWGEPRWLAIDRRRVPLSPAGGSLRLLHLSDFHASDVVPLEFIDHAISLGLAERPDLVLLTGDFITDRFDDFSGYANILGRLSATVPTFACLGNHDGGGWARLSGGFPTVTEILGLLRAANVRCLHNEAETVNVKGKPLQLIGVGDLWSRDCDPETAFGRVAPRQGASRVLLNHNPDAKEALRTFDWDLVLCGHTHGGQVRLPFLGTPFAPVADKRYVEGLHRWNERWLYITRGVGNLHGLRFNCRPQVSVITLG